MVWLTPPGLDHLVNLVPGIHGSQVEQLHNRPRVRQLRRVIRRRRELLQDLAAHARGGLLHLDHGAVPKIALDEEHHLIIAHEHLATAHVAEPSLHEGLDTALVLLCAGAGRCQSGRHGGDECLWVGRYEVVG